MAGIATGVGSTIFSPTGMVGAGFDGGIDVRLYVAERFSVYRVGNCVATEYTGIN